jgi:1-acyl-sn-glycerol-3-phosphate acyltransferase
MQISPCNRCLKILTSVVSLKGACRTTPACPRAILMSEPARSYTSPKLEGLRIPDAGGPTLVRNRNAGDPSASVSPLASLRAAAATLSSLMLGFPLTTILVAMGIIASMFGIRGFVKRGLVFWGNLVFWLNGRRLRVHGRSRIRPGARYLVLANHTSMLDIPVILAIVPDAALIGREKLTRIPMFNMLLKLIHYIPIDTERIRKAHDAIAEAIRKAGQGISIGMFPEGTRSPTGRVQKLKRGFVYVLRSSGLDVLPVTIRGTFALKPKKRFSYDPRERIEAFVHSPIPNGELAALSDHEIMEKVHSLLESEGGGSNGS